MTEQPSGVRTDDKGHAARAIFLDRDGTLLDLVPYLCDPHQVRLQSGAVQALRDARAAGYLLVVVSNQSGIARGYFTTCEVSAVHREVERRLSADGVVIDRFLFCPHHPEFTGPCECRKPAPGLFLLAARELGIDLRRSYAIGDTIEDVQAGHRAGCHSILVRTGYGEASLRQRRAELPPGTAVAWDLREAIERVVLGGAGDAR